MEPGIEDGNPYFLQGCQIETTTPAPRCKPLGNRNSPVAGYRTGLSSMLSRLPPDLGLMRHIIAILLHNEAGALTRVTSLFSTRGYNIESLSVAATNEPTVSRITLVTQGSEAVIQQIVNQLNKLIDVVSVEDMTTDEHIERELVLLKLKVRLEQADAVRGYVIRHGGRVIDPAAEAFVVELTASEAEINRFIAELSAGAELIEVVRSGALSISRLGRNLRVVR